MNTIDAPSSLGARVRDEIPEFLSPARSVDLVAYGMGAVGTHAVDLVIRPVAPADEPVSLPWWVDPVADRLRSLLELPSDWNSYGAAAVRPEAVYLAVRVLLASLEAEQTRPLPTIVPTQRGGLQLEWHSGGIDLEIDVDPEGSVEVLFEDTVEQKEWDGAMGERENDVRWALDRIAERAATAFG